jgi:hypothetical protein
MAQKIKISSELIGGDVDDGYGGTDYGLARQSDTGRFVVLAGFGKPMSKYVFGSTGQAFG